MPEPTAASSRGLPRISKQSLIIIEYGVYAKTEIIIYLCQTCFFVSLLWDIRWQQSYTHKHVTEFNNIYSVIYCNLAQVADIFSLLWFKKGAFYITAKTLRESSSGLVYMVKKN